MPGNVPIQGVLFTVFQSILQVFLLCLAGFMLSFRGIVDKPTSKVLNHINIALFTPALLFSKVAFFLTPAKLRELWVIPIFFTVLTGLSAVVAHWLARAFRLKRSQVNFATAASMFMNSNSLPVALMQSLATTVPLLKWGPDDSVDAMFGRSLTYLVVFSTLGMILRWSYGMRLISQADEPESTTPSQTVYRDVDGTDGHHVPATTQLIDCGTKANTESCDQTPWRTRPLHPHASRPRLTPVSWRHTHRDSVHHCPHQPAMPATPGDHSESEDSDELETTEGDSEETLAFRSEPIDTGFSTEVEDPTLTPPSVSLPSSSSPGARVTPRWAHHAPSSFLSSLMRLPTMFTSLSPPLLASLFAIFCVLVPPVQRLLVSKEISPFKGALDSAGECSIPLTLVVLGGWFWDGEKKRNSKGNRTAEGEANGDSDGRGNGGKGKGVGKRCHKNNRGNGTAAVEPVPAEQRRDTHVSATENVSPSLGRHVIPWSRDSSTASLSSMIGAVGDVLIARVRPRGYYRRTRRPVASSVEAGKGDVESGQFATSHTETENERTENASRPRSQTDPSLPTRGTSLPGETLTIFVTIVARMVIVPLIVIPLIVFAIRQGWGGEVFEDPVFIVSSMLLASSPPALTLAQISQRAKATTGARTGSATSTNTGGSFERLLSRTVFWAYCVLTPPVTIASVMVGLLSIRT